MKLITSNLMAELKARSQEAIHICWVTAFAMKSGVKLMLPELQAAQARGSQIQLLVGDYLCITQPDALRQLVEGLPNAEIRLYQSYGRSFHPKAYLFRNEDGQHVIVGSSNLSKSALTTGVEWSLQTVDLPTFEQAMEEFYKLFTSPNTVPVNLEMLGQYEARYLAANEVTPLSNKWSEAEETSLMYGLETEPSLVAEEKEVIIGQILPRPAQQLALEALAESVSLGYDKALAVMATGLGKTYLSAFFAEKYKRVLFIVHRDEILQQAKQAFSHVYPHKTAGYFNMSEKDSESDFIFASISTLAQNYHLQKFDPTAFDLIVVDEFHHAAANSYRKVMDYFQPQFLLGITATPDRLDNQDVFSLCDGNVAIEIHFLDAIARKWLSPFHYYGIKDEIDYAHIRWLGSKYDEEDLLLAQSDTDVLQRFYNGWKQHKQTRTLAFCSTVRQAELICRYFVEQGVKAHVLSGKSKATERRSIREQLIAGDIDIIFTVDLFNEGVDIPTVDTLLFMRPTESIAVFTQQIGRGLRVAEGKEHCVIIDFIGNYRNADTKLAVFKPNLIEKGQFKLQPTEIIAETGCVLHFDLSVINLLQEMAKKKRSRKQQIIDAYFDVKRELGRRPKYLEFYLQSPFVDVQIEREFGSYVAMLKAADELTEMELKVFNQHEKLLIEIEKTKMTRSYKMVVLYAMLQRGASEWYKPITAEQVMPIFKDYLSVPARQAIDKVQLEDKKVLTLIQKMPMTKWSGSSKELVIFENGQFAMAISVQSANEAIIFEWVQDICTFRLSRYFAQKGKLKDTTLEN